MNEQMYEAIVKRTLGQSDETTRLNDALIVALQRQIDQRDVEIGLHKQVAASQQRSIEILADSLKAAQEMDRKCNEGNISMTASELHHLNRQRLFELEGRIGDLTAYQRGEVQRLRGEIATYEARTRQRQAMRPWATNAGRSRPSCAPPAVMRRARSGGSRSRNVCGSARTCGGQRTAGGAVSRPAGGRPWISGRPIWNEAAFAACLHELGHFADRDHDARRHTQPDNPRAPWLVSVQAEIHAWQWAARRSIALGVGWTESMHKRLISALESYRIYAETLPDQLQLRALLDKAPQDIRRDARTAPQDSPNRARRASPGDSDSKSGSPGTGERKP